LEGYQWGLVLLALLAAGRVTIVGLTPILGQISIRRNSKSKGCILTYLVRWGLLEKEVPDTEVPENPEVPAENPELPGLGLLLTLN